MPSKKSGVDTKMILVLIASLLVIAVTGINYYNQVNQNHVLKEELRQKKAQLNERNKYNSKIEAKNILSASNNNLATTQDNATTLFSTMFEFGSWETYTKNSKSLGEKFPLLAQNELIDTTGKNAGVSSAPKSSYKIDYQLVNQEDQTATYLITQTITATNVTYIKNYYVKVKGADSTFNVIDFEVKKPLTDIK